MSFKQKVLNSYNWLVDKVKGKELKTVIAGSAIGGLAPVIASYLLRGINLTFESYFRALLSPLGIIAVSIGALSYMLFQVAISTEKISLLSPMASTITTAVTVMGGVLILSESLNLLKLAGVILCIIGIWAISKNHKK
ncbi:MAG: hypothetical protein PHW96_03240 [Candidatus Nanoarchaeia archaeon]|nr:hypothetical protein [Candidatus Nanoarchaeia archaeon]